MFHILTSYLYVRLLIYIAFAHLEYYKIIKDEEFITWHETSIPIARSRSSSWDPA